MPRPIEQNQAPNRVSTRSKTQPHLVPPNPVRHTALNSAQRTTIRMTLATGATIATLIGAQTLALLDRSADASSVSTPTTTEGAGDVQPVLAIDDSSSNNTTIGLFITAGGGLIVSPTPQPSATRPPSVTSSATSTGSVTPRPTATNTKIVTATPLPTVTKQPTATKRPVVKVATAQPRPTTRSSR